nr:MAG TPA_asm: hypothetical protein [Caudoviricetes sp.]
MPVGNFCSKIVFKSFQTETAKNEQKMTRFPV